MDFLILRKALKFLGGSRSGSSANGEVRCAVIINRKKFVRHHAPPFLTQSTHCYVVRDRALRAHNQLDNSAETHITVLCGTLNYVKRGSTTRRRRIGAFSCHKKKHLGQVWSGTSQCVIGCVWHEYMALTVSWGNRRWGQQSEWGCWTAGVCSQEHISRNCGLPSPPHWTRAMHSP